MAMIGDKKRPQGTFDSSMEFKDAGVIGTSAAAQVDSAAKYVDLGTGLFKGCMILDVTALEVANGDEIYTICLQLSTDALFTNDATSCTAAKIEIGSATPLLLGAVDAIGRYKLYFDNEHNQTYFRYARLYTVVAGTVASGINYSAWCVPIQ